MQQAPHTIIVNDDHSITIECPGIEAGQCAHWAPCAVCNADPTEARRAYDQLRYYTVSEHHGVQHRIVRSDVCISTDRCTVVEHTKENDIGIYEYFDVDKDNGLLRPTTRKVHFSLYDWRIDYFSA